MKILYDYQAFEIQKKGGVSRTFDVLIDTMSRFENTEVELPLLFSDNEYIKSRNIQTTLWKIISFIKPNNFLRRLLRFINKKNSIRKIKKQDFDIFHPTYFDGYFLEYIQKKPFVVSIYDMVHEIYPDIFEQRNTTSVNKKLLADHASMIVAISHSTKRDIIKYYKIPEKKIRVVQLANLLSIENPEFIETPKKYILYVGMRGKYKNFNFFIKAFSVFSKDNSDLYVLCIGGNKFNKEELQLFDNLSIKNKVSQRTVNDNQLVYLYKNALFFIFPSLYEGFGLPVLEAFSCNCPALISNTSCFPEIAGNAGLYFDPQSETSIIEGLKKISGSSELRKELIIKGNEQLKKFSAKRMAEEMRVVYNEIIFSSSHTQ